MPVQGGGWRRPVRWVLGLFLFLSVTACFALAAYLTRQSSPRDLAFVLIEYFLLALLVGCVARLEHLRHDPAAAAAKAGQRRWLRIAVGGISMSLAKTFVHRVVDVMPSLPLKLVVVGITAVVLGLEFYFLFLSDDAGEPCCDEDRGRGQA